MWGLVDDRIVEAIEKRFQVTAVCNGLTDFEFLHLGRVVFLLLLASVCTTYIYIPTDIHTYIHTYLPTYIYTYLPTYLPT